MGGLEVVAEGVVVDLAGTRARAAQDTVSALSPDPVRPGQRSSDRWYAPRSPSGSDTLGSGLDSEKLLTRPPQNRPCIP